MQVRLDARTYAEHWERESFLLARMGAYGRLSEITPQGNVLEIGCGSGLGTLALARSRKVLALDSNVDLVEKAKARIEDAEVCAQVLLNDVFSPSPEVVKLIKHFAPKVIAGWFLGASADDQEKYVSVDVPSVKRASKYREHLEDALIAQSVCPASVEWVHLAIRRVVGGVPDEIVKNQAKQDYDKDLFLPNGFEVTAVHVLDWDMAGSTFGDAAAGNPDLRHGEPLAKTLSVLARRKAHEPSRDRRTPTPEGMIR